MTFAVDYQQLRNPGDSYDRFKNGLTSMDQQLERNHMKRSLNLADLRTAHEKKQPTVVQSVEGAHFLEGRLEQVEEAYNRGLRHFGLLHDSDASVPLGDVYTNPPRWGGLTEFGAKIIKECNRLGITASCRSLCQRSDSYRAARMSRSSWAKCSTARVTNRCVNPRICGNGLPLARACSSWARASKISLCSSRKEHRVRNCPRAIMFRMHLKSKPRMLYLGTHTKSAAEFLPDIRCALPQLYRLIRGIP